jgi:predicted metal-dependent hydrolase
MDNLPQNDPVEDFRRELHEIAQELTSNNGVEIHGKLKIEVSEMDTLALLKGNRIYLNIEAKDYPKHILKYILAHEIAHLAIKRHTKKFWEIVRNIYPDYTKAHEELLRKDLNFQ